MIYHDKFSAVSDINTLKSGDPSKVFDNNLSNIQIGYPSKVFLKESTEATAIAYSYNSIKSSGNNKMLKC